MINSQEKNKKRDVLENKLKKNFPALYKRFLIKEDTYRPIQEEVPYLHIGNVIVFITDGEKENHPFLIESNKYRNSFHNEYNMGTFYEKLYEYIMKHEDEIVLKLL